VLLKRALDLIALVKAKQSCIDEYARELVANCSMNQRSSHCRVHAA
jgi:hypothetical protein